MLKNFRITYANVVSTLALFVVVSSGTAIAAGVTPNSVKSSSVANNSLVSADLKDGKAVTGADVRDDSLTGADIDEGTLKLPAPPAPAPAPAPAQAPTSLPPSGPAGGSLAGEFPNPTLAPNSVGKPQLADATVDSAKVQNKSITGADVASRSIGGDAVDEASLASVPEAALGGTGRSAPLANCNPDANQFVTCNSVSITLARPARVLLIARATGNAEGSGNSNVGSCVLGTSANGALGDTEQNIGKAVTKTFFTITKPIAAGNVSFGLDCVESSGIKFKDVTISAVALSGS